jgi:hypothetical protein
MDHKSDLGSQIKVGDEVTQTERFMEEADLTGIFGLAVTRDHAEHFAHRAVNSR